MDESQGMGGRGEVELLRPDPVKEHDRSLGDGIPVPHSKSTVDVISKIRNRVVLG